MSVRAQPACERRNRRASVPMCLPSLQRLRVQSTGGFVCLTPNEVKDLNAQGERDPITLEDFSSPFEIRVPTSNGTILYRKTQNAKALWAAIKSVYQQTQRWRFPAVQIPIWYEDWWELRNQYEPSYPAPPSVDQLLRFANYDPASPPAWVGQEDWNELMDQIDFGDDLSALVHGARDAEAPTGLSLEDPPLVLCQLVTEHFIADNVIF